MVVAHPGLLFSSGGRRTYRPLPRSWVTRHRIELPGSQCWSAFPPRAPKPFPTAAERQQRLTRVRLLTQGEALDLLLLACALAESTPGVLLVGAHATCCWSGHIRQCPTIDLAAAPATWSTTASALTQKLPGWPYARDNDAAAWRHPDREWFRVILHRWPPPVVLQARKRAVPVLPGLRIPEPATQLALTAWSAGTSQDPVDCLQYHADALRLAACCRWVDRPAALRVGRRLGDWVARHLRSIFDEIGASS